MADITITSDFTGLFTFVQEKLNTLFKSGACGTHPGAGRKDFTLFIEDLPREHVTKVLGAIDDLREATDILCSVEVLMD